MSILQDLSDDVKLIIKASEMEGILTGKCVSGAPVTSRAVKEIRPSHQCFIANIWQHKGTKTKG